MKTLLYTSLLGIACMLAEMLNLRRLITPLASVGLLVIAVLALTQWDSNEIAHNNMLIADNFSLAFSALILVAASFIIALSGHFYKNEQNKISDYTAITVFVAAGAVAMVSFGNLAMFLLGLEVLSVSLYVLAGGKRKQIKSGEAAMKYFLMGSFASGMLLFGIALIYGETASFDLQVIASHIESYQPSVLTNAGVALILVALLFKVSAAPFHFWAPDVYEGAPTLTTALMATISKVAAFAAFYRLFSACFIPVYPVFAWVFTVVAILTLVIGNLSALQQDSFKRMLAFSGISHAGYMLLAILSLYGKTDNALFFYAFAYTFASIAAFSIAIVVSENTGSEKIEAFNGLGKSKPMMAAALTIAMLSMAGIPPLAGFFAKYFMFSEAIKNGHLLLTLVAVIASVVSVYYYFKVIVAMYTTSSEGKHIFQLKPVYATVLLVSVALTIAAGLFPSVLANLF